MLANLIRVPPHILYNKTTSLIFFFILGTISVVLWQGGKRKKNKKNPLSLGTNAPTYNNS